MDSWIRLGGAMPFLRQIGEQGEEHETANEGQRAVRRERFGPYIRRGIHAGIAPVRSGCRPALFRVWFALVITGRSAGRGNVRGGDAHALDHNCFHPLDDRGCEEVPRCCRSITVERPQVAETCLVISNHLLERLDKIRLPTGRKHGSALRRRPPWQSSFMHAHRARSFDRGERVPLGKCG